MKVVHIISAVDGTLDVKFIELPKFTVEAACAHLGQKVNDGNCVMDEVDVSKIHAGAFSIAFAQEKPWTYIRHVFVVQP